MINRLFFSVIALLSMNYLQAQMACTKITGNYVNNYDFEISEYEPDPQSCIDFPTICGDNFCEWYRAFGKPKAGGNTYGSSSCCRNISLQDEPGNFICGIYQNNVVLPDGVYQGRIEIMCDHETVVNIDKIVIGLTNGLDQNNTTTEFITESQLPANHVLKTFTNIPRPDGTFTIIPYEFTLSNGQGLANNQLFIYTMTTQSVILARFWLDNVVIKKKLYAEAGVDRTECYGIPLKLGGLAPSTTAIGGMPTYQYLWTCNNSSWTSTEENPTLIPETTTTYYLTVKDEGGIGNIATDQVTITVDNNCPCKYPLHVFDCMSPGNDGNYYGNICIANNPNSNGNIVISGYSLSNSLTLSNGYTLSHPNTGAKKFIAKLSKKGYTQWAHLFEDGAYLLSGHSIYVDEQDNTYVLLYRWGNSQNKFENGYTIQPGSPSQFSFFLLKINSLGSIVWSRVFNDLNGQESQARDFAISDDGLYILGETINGFQFNEQLAYPGGAFLIKLNKSTGMPIWFITPPPNPSNFTEGFQISIKDNIPYIGRSYYPTQVFKINPTNGTIMLPIITKPLGSGSLSTDYGGSSIFYDFSWGNYPSNSSIRSFKLETVSGKEVFNYKKSVEGPARFSMGYSPIDDYIYYQKVIIDAGNHFLPDKFIKQNMINSSGPSWIKDISTMSDFQPACNKVLNYGYYIAENTNYPNQIILDQFNLSTGNFGCIATKSSEEDGKINQSPLNDSATYLEIFPNPAGNILYLKYKFGSLDKRLDIKCYNSLGKIEFEQSFLMNEKAEKMLDISKLKCGFYYLVATSKENSFTQTLKLIKN